MARMMLRYGSIASSEGGDAVEADVRQRRDRDPGGDARKLEGRPIVEGQECGVLRSLKRQVTHDADKQPHHHSAP